jgi:hypothetical protein
MQIVVTQTGKKGAKSFIVEVLDGTAVIHTESVKGLKQRDELVWRLADLYNILDIAIAEQLDTFKFSEIPSIPVLEEDEADMFFGENLQFVHERILQAVDEGIKANKDYIRLFELNGTGVYITSNKEDWSQGVEHAMDYFASMEQYDKCIIARQLLQKL